MNYDEVPHTDIPSLIRQKIRFLSDDYRSMQHHKEVVIEHTEKINRLEAVLDYEAIRDPMHPSGWGLTSAYDRLIYSYRMMDTTLHRMLLAEREIKTLKAMEKYLLHVGYDFKTAMFTRPLPKECIAK